MLVEITDNTERSRFEVAADGEFAGFVSYRLSDEHIALTHAETDPRYAGRGLASQLVKAALENARDRGLAVLPFCPFVRDYLQRHDEFLDLVPADQRTSLEL